jgi:hypothetical protein
MADTTPPVEHPLDAMSQEEIGRLIMDMLHRIVIHYGLWFTEVRHQMGTPKAHEIMAAAQPKSFGIQAKRLGKSLGFELRDALPAPLLAMPREALQNLLKAMAANWLANDGVWFQAVEFNCGMNDAKRCNDSCWAHFSPFEAWSIKRFLGLGAQPGLEGLKKALQLRLYAFINVYSIIDEGPDSLVFQMNECRVQVARKRKGLDDYPCKSVGLVEYPYFASAVDNRITTECIGCPPDPHPAEWYCAWRFKL